MNTIPASNGRYVIVLIAVLTFILLLLAINIVAWFLLMGGGMMGIGGMMGMNGQTMNDMVAACANMMQNFESP